MPQMKLRIKYNTNLHDRYSELFSQPVQADGTVGAFCEYTIAYYNERMEETDPTLISSKPRPSSFMPVQMKPLPTISATALRDDSSHV